ncbi:hypothetical protein PS1_036238 [Malus domestica]
MATSLMIRNSIFFIIFACLWSLHDAKDTLKPGDTLNSSSTLVSASGKFVLKFVVQTIDGSNTSYIAILRDKQGANKAWIGNRNSPIPYPSSPLLTFDLSNTLRITNQGLLSLDWDPNGKQLRIKQGGVVNWTSGVFDDGSIYFS